MDRLENDLKLIAERIKSLRELLDISENAMAELHGISVEEYRRFETGEVDYDFTFLHKTAQTLGVDIAELLTGENPHLASYSLERKGEGLTIERRKGFHYLHLASRFKDRLAEPFVVTAPYSAGNETAEVRTSTHEGQEMDMVLEGSLKVVIGTKTEILNEGDTVFYNSQSPHGMVAVGGKDCKFLAVVMKR